MIDDRCNLNGEDLTASEAARRMGCRVVVVKVTIRGFGGAPPSVSFVWMPEIAWQNFRFTGDASYEFEGYADE